MSSLTAVALIVLTLVAGCGTSASAPATDQVSKPSEPDSAPAKKPPRAIAQVEIDPVPLKQATEQIALPQKVYRPDDKRLRHDDRRLAEAGIRTYVSRRLKLYTDAEESVAQHLPELVDQLYDALESYFGPMPPDRAGTEFQMTGYLIRDLALFRESGLAPDEVVIDHGRHRGNEFWMRDQTIDYYRRHLMLHEATHCFMTYMPETQAPVWYLEGMAEHFGTHVLDAEHKATFRVMPTSPVDFAGFGRIEAIRDDVAHGRRPAIESVINFRSVDFRTLSHYAWSWALCAFLDGTPRYRDRFRQLGASMHGDQFPQEFEQQFKAELRDIETEWTLFGSHLQYGYDVERASIDFVPGQPLSAEQQSANVEIAANRSWQSSRILLERGRTYRITATGQFSLGEKPRPWISEAQGITFRYFDGLPIGMLLGCLCVEDGSSNASEETMLKTIALGVAKDFEAPVRGTLYLRLNDAWNSLSDNRGEVEVTIREISETEQKK